MRDRHGFCVQILGLAVVLSASGVLLPGTCDAAAGTSKRPVPSAQQWPLDASHFDARRAWALSEGAGVTVAVVDTGVAAVPDLTGALVAGINEATGTPITSDESEDSHGTSVASVIAGRGDGSDGAVAGLAPRARVLPVVVSGDSGEGADPAAVARGISYAAEHGVKVINVSLGLSVDDPEVRAAVAEAVRRDVVVVAAAGNDGRGANTPVSPADLPGVLAVSGSTRASGVWPDGQSGPYVSLLAPAEAIYCSASTPGKHLLASGTTYSGAYVSAAAALVRSSYPKESAGQTIRRLLDSATRVAGASANDRIVSPLGALQLPVPAGTSDPLSTVPTSPATTATRTDSASNDGWVVAVIAAGGVLLVGMATGGWWWSRRRRSSTGSRR